MTVKLAKPLVFESTEGQKGLVLELSTEFMVLDSSLDTTENTVLSLTLNAGQSYKFEGNYEDSLFKLQSSESLESMVDLLGQVRKDQHIEICNNLDVESSDRYTGFSKVNFMPDAWPNLDFKDLDTTQNFLGREFSYPILITGMTGGVNKGEGINRNLALMAEKYNIPMGVGSQRIAVDNPKYNDIFNVKKFAKIFS